MNKKKKSKAAKEQPEAAVNNDAAEKAASSESESKTEEKSGNESAERLKSIKNGKDKKVKKHSKLKIFAVVILLLIIAAGLTVVYNVIKNRDFTVSFYQLRSDKVSDNIRIIELADLHNNVFGNNNDKLVKTIEDLKPDLIFYAGDMMNQEDGDYSVLFDLSDRLCKIAPIYACYGNNELSRYLFTDREFADKLVSHNVNLLSNEAVDIEIGNTVIQLIAVTDNVSEFDVETNNAKKFLEKLQPTENCRVCLTHYPELFLSKLLDRSIDIAFTGHAHGGLIRIPKIGGIYSPGEGFLPTLTEGVVEMKDGAQVVISRGLGDSSAIPRINNQPELVVTDICWY